MLLRVIAMIGKLVLKVNTGNKARNVQKTKPVVMEEDDEFKV